MTCAVTPLAAVDKTNHHSYFKLPGQPGTQGTIKIIIIFVH